MLFGLATGAAFPKAGGAAAKGLLVGAFPKLKEGAAGRPSSLR